MSTFMYHYRPSVRSGRSEGSIFIRIIHHRRTLSITTPHRIFPEEWDSVNRCVILPPSSSRRYARLKSLRDEMDMGLCEYERTVARLGSFGDFTIDDIKAEYASRKHSRMLSDFVDTLYREMYGRQPRTAKAYRSVVNSFLRFNNGRDIKLSQVNRTLMEAFESHLKESGLKPNTTSFYMRNMRSVYNKALARNLVTKSYENPFSTVFTGTKTTDKRSLEPGHVKGMMKLDRHIFDMRFRKKSRLDPAMRDCLAMFIFCFYAQGMSFVDMAYLRKEDIHSNVIRYRRKKTGRQIEVPISAEMRSVIEYFSTRMCDSIYVFPVIMSKDKPERLQYESALRLQNMRLKKLGLLLPASRKITTHAARHTWATIAKNENVALPIISEALGHNSEKTTRIYLDSFKKEHLDEATERIRRAIKKAV